MTNMINVNATVVSHASNDNPRNTDNFYLNGRFKYDYEMDNIQVSVQNNAEEFIFAVCDSLDKERAENKTPISLVRELKRFQEQIKGNGKAIESIYLQLVERVEEISNLIHSASLVTPEIKESKASFAGLVVAQNKAVVLSMGNCKVYMARGGNIKQITSDHKKAERLIKLGIISSEQAEVLSKDYEGIPSEKQSDIQISTVFNIEEGDVFLLCSNGLTDVLEDEKIYEIMAMNFGPEYISNTLIKEVIKGASFDNSTALTVKLEGIDNTMKAVPNNFKSVPENVRKSAQHLENEEEESNSKTYIAAIITSVVIICAIIAGYLIWNTVKKDIDGKTSKPQTVATNNQKVAEEVYKESQPVVSNPSTSQAVTSTPTTSNKEPVRYTVKAGDNLAKISNKFYNDSNKTKLIMDANNIKDPNRISIGQVLIIPELKK